jgi:ADP-ribose pyrophosphatase YjhB (NUDIX family)
MLYDILKICVSICFNILNRLLGGKLPPFGTACVIVEEEGKYLVIELPRRRIVFPGGFMTWREKPEQAAEREGREETGLSLHAHELIGIYSHASANIAQMSNFCFAYKAEVVGGKLRKNVEGRPCWLTEAELRERLPSVTLQILDDYLDARARSQQRAVALPELATLPRVS